MSERILAFDLGTSLGWCALIIDHEAGESITSGTIKLPPSSHDRTAHLVKSLVEFQRLINLHRPTIVAYEAVRHIRGVDATLVWAGLETTLLLACDACDVLALGLGVASIKKHATGRGNADKLAMTTAAMRRWPHWEPGSEDEVDARWVASAASVGVAPVSAKHKRSRSNG